MSACMVCGAAPAPYGLGWPGFAADQPAAIRGKRLRLCAFGGECHARGIARAEAAAGIAWPFSPVDADLAARVAEIRGRAPRPAPALLPQATLI